MHSLPVLPIHAQVLELGCGNGKTLSAMSHQGWNVTGIDLSPHATHLAQQVFPGMQEGNLAVADVRQMPFCSGSFDAMFAFHVLGHQSVADRAIALQELCRVIRAGGQIFFRDFSTHDFRYGRGRETEPGTFLRGTGIQTHYFTVLEVVDLFKGFVAESVDTCTWPMRVMGTAYVRSEINAVFVKKT
ncbi:class I SAM-dependent methyltransferase [Methanoregula sp.]|uniref:class I SAM-dependent methyltransferase n=1 Tax=Methanoregula sp. TaxID=2052170 RepID=UPI003C18B762